MPITDEKITAFTKDVSDLADKPTGLSAAQVKAQFDAAPEELRVAHNGLIDVIAGTTAGDSGAHNVGSAPITGVTGATVYAQMSDIKTQLNSATTGTLPDGSVTTAKLADLGVATAKLANGAVTEGKLNSKYFAAVGLTGATAGGRWVGTTSSGAPTTGTFVVGDFVNTRAGEFWSCTVAGTPGTWTKSGVNPTAANLISGTYTGDGTNNRIIPVGSAPKLLWLNGRDVAGNATQGYMHICVPESNEGRSYSIKAFIGGQTSGTPAGGGTGAGGDGYPGNTNANSEISPKIRTSQNGFQVDVGIVNTPNEVYKWWALV